MAGWVRLLGFFRQYISFVLFIGVYVIAAKIVPENQAARSMPDS
jgi:phage shock protein PspC (stress-responsive transcriptional regulator)